MKVNSKNNTITRVFTLLIMGAMILMCFALTSCGSDDNEDKIVGTWIVNEEVKNGKVKTYSDDRAIVYIFDSDGNYQSKHGINGKIKEEGTYTVDEKSLTLRETRINKYGKKRINESTFGIETLTDEKMVLTYKTCELRCKKK